MRLFGLGPTELVIILFFVLPATLVPVIGFYKIAKRAGYSGGVSALFGIGYLVPVVNWFIPLVLGLAAWPRDAAAGAPSQSPVGPPPVPPSL